MIYIRITAALFLGLNLACMSMQFQGRSNFFPSTQHLGRNLAGGYMSSAIKTWKGSGATKSLERTKQGSAMAKIMTLARATAKPGVNTRLGWLYLLTTTAANASFTAVVPDPYSLMRTAARRSVSLPTSLTISSE